MKKTALKGKIFKKVENLVDGVEKIGSLDFFEINIKVVNGKVIMSLSNPELFIKEINLP